MSYFIDLANMREYRKRIKEFRPIDDTFLSFMVHDSKETVEYILKTILNRDDLQILDVHSQEYVQNIFGRSARFDVLAQGGNNEKLNIEVQRTDAGADPKRARFNSAVIDAHDLQSGANWNELKETYTIFITEHDVLKGGLPIYHIERKILETDSLFGDGEHIIYVNSAHQDLSTELGRMMHDFYCSNPEDMLCQPIKERVRMLKETKEGNRLMCESMEQLQREAELRGIELGKAEGKAEGKEEILNTFIASIRKKDPAVSDDNIIAFIHSYLDFDPEETRQSL